jgi:hypothetical protein
MMHAGRRRPLPAEAAYRGFPADGLRCLMPAMKTAAASRYDADVPDTLDLAERARAAVNGLVGIIDHSRRHQPHQCMQPYRNPPVLSPASGATIFDGGNEMWGKHAEALVEMRHMSGSAQEPGRDDETFLGMVSCIEDDGLLYSYAKKIDGDHLVEAEDFADLVSGARAMLALIAKHQVDGNREWLRHAGRLSDGYTRHAVRRDGYAYYPDGHVGGAISRPRSGWKSLAEPLGTNLADSRDWYECASNVLFTYGGIVQALCRWHRVSGNLPARELAGALSRFMQLPRFWVPEAGPGAVIGSEHAHFEGHIHATARGLWGLLEYADLANDERLKSFVRDGYEYIRGFGIARIGLFGETCTIGDMTALAVRLSDAGVGDFWEDVDQYTRNHLAEVQILDPAPIAAIAAASPAAPVRPWEESDRFVERTLGCLCDDALHPTLSTPGLMMCCTYNGLIGYYHSWEGIVRAHGAMAQVNLLLNRASPWLDVNSHLPYEGKVVLKNKTARTIAVRMPRWVDPTGVGCAVDGRRVEPGLIGRHLVFEGVRPGAEVRLEFPVVESTATYTVGWTGIQVPGWTEVTRLLDQDKPPQPFEYQVSAVPRSVPAPARPVVTIRFRGNDAVDISPRETGPGYPLYRREHLKAGPAPMRKVTRVVPEKVIEI